MSDNDTPPASPLQAGRLEFAIDPNVRKYVEVPKLEEPIEQNYPYWKVIMGIYLRRYGCKEATDGGVALITPDQDLNCRELILLSMPKFLVPILADMPTARDMWVHIQERCAPISEANVVSLTRELYTMRMTATETPSEYIGRITKVYRQLLASGSLVPEASVCTQVIAGLTKDYEIAANILVQSQVPLTLNDLAKRLKDAHLMKQARPDAFISEPMAMYVKKGQRPTCSHCSKKGHTKDKCWLLHPELKEEHDAKKKQKKKEEIAFGIYIVETDDDNSVENEVTGLTTSVGCAF